MELKNFNTHFFLLILAGVSVFTFFIFKPFLIAILLAAVFAVIFQGPYKFFVKLTRGRQKISAFLTSLLGMIIFVSLFLGIAGLIANEAANLFQNSMKAGDAYNNY